MLKIIHTADIHIGMENYGRLDPVTGIHTRLIDFQKALNHCIDYAIDHEADLFLFAGDAYKTATPSPTHQRILFDALLRLFRARIPVVMVIGNHDHPMSFGKTHALDIFRQAPLHAFHVIHKPELVTVPTANGPVQVAGIPWPSRAMVQVRPEFMRASQQDITQHISDGVAHIITQLAARCDPTIPSILLGHLTVSNGIFSGSEKKAIYGSDPVLMPSQLAIAPFDYVALGHLHRYQNLNTQGYPAVVYSGSIERIDFGERKETKGFCVVEIPAKDHARHEFYPVPTRPFIQIEVTLSDAHGHTQQLLAAIAAHVLDEAVVKIVYHVPEGIVDKIDKAQIMQACSRAHYVVGLVPVRAQSNKAVRATLRVDMSPEDMLRSYARSKEVSDEQLERILTKSHALSAQLAHGITHDSSI